MKLFYRIYQFALRVVAMFLPWRKPVVLKGEGATRRLPQKIQELGITNALIVTDKGIMRTGMVKDLQEICKKAKIVTTIFDNTISNPTIRIIEEGYQLYKEAGCNGFIAFGGGSPIDTAKAIGIRVVRPDTPLEKMAGLLKVKKQIPPLIAIPTTAGTGSEATIATVITNEETNKKFAISDLHLIPRVAILDPHFTTMLPKDITAATGMDALTHAIEAYIGRSNTKETIDYATQAIKNIFKYLEIAYTKPSDLFAREKMLEASYYAGLAFTRAYVGNVHAIAHTFGGFYHIPHGYANAIILPHVLRYYGSTIDVKLAELAHIAGVAKGGDSVQQKAVTLIRAIDKMNKKMNIPTSIKIPNTFNIDRMVEYAFKEANPLYPVPTIFSRKDFRNVIESIIEIEEKSEKT